MCKEGERQRSFDYKIVNSKTINNRVYQLIEVSPPSTKRTLRKKFLEKIIDKAGAIGLMEWWISGGIIQKPKKHFRCILVMKYK
jgi:hypothetical protein